MRHENSLMHDVLKFIPWSSLERLVDEHDADRNVRTLTTKSQFIALLHGQLSGASSLREICDDVAEPQPTALSLGSHRPEALDARGRQCAATR